LGETDDAVDAQVQLWDRSTVMQAGWDQAARNKTIRDAGAFFRERVAEPARQQVQAKISEFAPQWSRAHAEQAGAGPHPLDRQIMKFCRLLSHAGLRLDGPPDTASLHDLCLQVERHAVRALAEIDERSMTARLKRQPRNGFDGKTTDDLVRYVIQRTFEQLDAEFRTKTAAEQEEIAARISAALRDLPPEEQERIRKTARLPDLTAETLRQTGRFASLGVGLSGMVGLAGFTAYTTLTSVVAAVTGLVGIHLSFGTYMVLTSSLAGLANPLFFIPMLAGGATWMASKANRSIRGVLYPTFVATSVMSYAASDDADLPITAFADRVRDLVCEIGTRSDQHVAPLVVRFPGLGNPSVVARLASHVAG
jgi:hypothetical protein